MRQPQEPIAPPIVGRVESLRVHEAFAWELPGALAWGQQVKHFQMVAKRTTDIVISGAAIMLLAIPLLLVMLAIKIDSRGPVFFKQDRVGHNGKPFTMYKFRSMVADAEAARSGLRGANEQDAPLFKIKDDPRRTRVGKFIRRFSIDELPQLFNVLLGHMSLVGPRPALYEEASQYDSYHAHRIVAVPGMTGLWQVNGRSALKFQEMVEMDLRYARDWSFFMDVAILVKTVPTILSGKGAY